MTFVAKERVVLPYIGKEGVRKLATINYAVTVSDERFYRLRVLRELKQTKARYQTYLVYVVREIKDEEDL